MTGAILAANGGLPPLQVSVAPAFNSAATNSAAFTFSPASTATASGGSGTYSYSWSLSSTDGSWGFTSGQATASPTVHVTVGAIGSTGDATITCTVTDTLTGLTVTSADVPLSYTRTA